ncbi:MAG: hypothetical protein IH962_03395 [Chloroflexi bacterium]|nr:hypothetical protein [Chloroflexota bacterium]
MESMTVAPSDDPVATEVAPQRAEPTQYAEAPPPGRGGDKQQVVGDENIVAGRDIIHNYTSQVEHCKAGDERIEVGERTYQCNKCRHYPVCERHYDSARRMCSECMAGQTVDCAMCGDQLPQDQTFTCPRCRKIVGTNHQDNKWKNWCTECGAREERLIASIDDKGVAISEDGTVVTRDEVYLKDGTFWTKAGDKSVTTIKPQTFYARPRQWHEVRKPLLRREKQAMARFYSGMELGQAPDGDLSWQGPVRTWAGNSYQIMLRYPHRFPYAPPRAFVLEPKIAESRHIYKDGHLCLFHVDDKAWKPEGTAALVMTWVCLWLHCYEVWQETGEWPGEEADQVVNRPVY